MILGTGIDAVEVARFADWHLKPIRSLQRIFSDTEIAYCLSDPALSAQRFAVRFAAREAVYKIVSNLPGLTHVPFLTVAHAVTITKHINGAPTLILDWQRLGFDILPTIRWHISLTHTSTVAMASVIAEKL